MDSRRLLELALETLNVQKNAIEDEIAQLKSELPRPAGGLAPKTIAPAARTGRTAAQRKAQSVQMKSIWATKRKAKVPKPTSAKKSQLVKAKPALSAANKTRSEKMKAYWAKKRRAGTTQK